MVGVQCTGFEAEIAEMGLDRIGLDRDMGCDNVDDMSCSEWSSSTDVPGITDTEQTVHLKQPVPHRLRHPNRVFGARE